VTATAIALGVVAVALAGVLVLVLRMQAAERRDWILERRSLVDRVIAQHVGEVIALDRNATPKAPHAETERPVAVGL